jgi:hypothetical protein
MSETSKFESRVARLSCSPEVFYNFITDIRHFEQFIPGGAISNWQAEKEKCHFQVPSFGKAEARISEKTPFRKVVFSGNVLQNNEFFLIADISENGKSLSEVKLTLTADLNPFLRLMAAGPIERALETLVAEMEKFEKWI